MELITNRTLQDVERWRTLRDKGWESMTTDEREEWSGKLNTTPNAARGMYTHNDLNRVERAVDVISKRLRELGYAHETLSVKVDWQCDDVFTKADMVRYLNNLTVIRNTAVAYPDTPPVPNVNGSFDYVKANNIEQLLLDLDAWTSKVNRGWLFTGDIFSGEI